MMGEQRKHGKRVFRVGLEYTPENFREWAQYCPSIAKLNSMGSRVLLRHAIGQVGAGLPDAILWCRFLLLTATLGVFGGIKLKDKLKSAIIAGQNSNLFGDTEDNQDFGVFSEPKIALVESGTIAAFADGVSSILVSNPMEGSAISDVSEDMDQISANQRDTLFMKPLFQTTTLSNTVLADQADLFSLFDSDKSLWSFWREWYQGFLDGTPMDWELQRRVALIEDAIWEAGPEAVAVEIEKVRAGFELEQEIARLKEQMKASAAVMHAPQMGDNGGPPLEEDAKAIAKEMVIVWGAIEELEAEIAKPEPSPSVLKRIAQVLWDVSIRLGKYCGGLADVALQESVKEVAKFGAKAGITYYTAVTAAQNESLQTVAKAIWAFVKTLP